MEVKYAEAKNPVKKTFEFDTKEEAKKGLRKIAKENNMKRNSMGTYINFDTFLELNTNF